MAELLSIYNRALIGCKAGLIANPDDVGDRNAGLCRAIFHDARDDVLRMHPWNCATKRAQVSPSAAAAPKFGWIHAYDFPNEFFCLRVLSCGEGVKFKVEGRKILTDEGPPLNVTYIGRIEPGDMDPGVALTLSAFMAWELAPELTTSRGDVERLEKRFNRIRIKAQNTNGQEGDADELPESDWVTARR